MLIIKLLTSPPDALCYYGFIITSRNFYCRHIGDLDKTRPNAVMRVKVNRYVTSVRLSPFILGYPLVAAFTTYCIEAEA